MLDKKRDFKYTGYNSKHTEIARTLRKEMTPQERKLWYRYLKNYSVKMYRQRPIDRFIVDFYCPNARLIIELDGNQHYTREGQEYDQIRTEILEQYELEVIRFSNSQIDQQFSVVCTEIDYAVKSQLHRLSASAENV